MRDPWVVGEGPTGRERAEGYRYALGHLARIIEFEVQQDPRFPYFQRYVRMLSKWTIDNPDTMYLVARIDGEGSYRIRGRAEDWSEWHSGERAGPGPKAPRLVTFQTTTAVIGDTGSLKEFPSCRNQTLGAVQHFEIHPDAEGRFEILAAPERPEGYDGLFLPTRARLACTSRDGGETTWNEREAFTISLRESFSDWDAEVPLELSIVREDARGAPRPALDADAMAAQLEAIAEKLPSQIAFWNSLHELGLEVRGDRDLDGRRNMPVNDLNPPAPPFIAGGTAGARQLYAGGSFALGPEEALVVRVETPEPPHYMGFQLANFWGESLDQANATSSRTAAQLPPASDGARYYVVAHRDPAVPGWLDTTGHGEGTMSMRFVFRDEPPDAALPRVEVTATTLAGLAEHLPADTPRVSPEVRREEVARRQAHIQRRWRQY